MFKLKLQQLKLLEIMTFIVLILIYFISIKYQIYYFKEILGLILLIFLPGYYLAKIVKLDRYLNKISFWGFSITLSIAIINFVFVLLGQYLIFKEGTHITVVLTINIILFIIAQMLPYFKKYNNYKPKETKLTKTTLLYLFIGLIPLLMFIARSIINPYLIDQDGAGYISIMNVIKEKQYDCSILNPGRFGFTYIIMSIHFITGIDFLNIFKFILPGIIWVSFISIFGLLQEIKNKYLVIVLYLSIFISPAFIGQVDRIKPEEIAFIMAVPAIILFYISVIKKKYYYFFLGLIFCFVGSKSHETGTILLLSYLIGGLGIIIYNFQYWKKHITINNIILLLIIIFPYFIIFKPIAVAKGILITLSQLTPTAGVHKFSWWFLNHYESGGSQLGWPGWTFLIFYFFNGILIILIAMIFLIVYFKKIYNQNKDFIIIMIPVLINFIIFGVVSEILPRFGYFYVPDRAYVDLFYYSLILLIFLIIFSQKFIRRTIIKYLKFLLVINLIVGIIATIFLTIASGSLASRGERNLIDQIKNKTEVNSIILSTQSYNDILIKNYTNRDFISINIPNSVKEDIFKNNNSSGILNEYIIKQIKQEKIIYDIKKFPVKYQGIYISYMTEMYGGLIKFPSGGESTEKLIEPQRSDLIIRDNIPVYLIYSFTKTDGYLNKLNRIYWSSGIDSINRDLFWNIQGENIIYRDQSGIIIKIR